MNLQEFRKEFDVHFSAFVKRKVKEYKNLAKDKETREFFTHLETYVKGGKRLRPYAAFMAFSESGKQISEKEWLVFISLELVHVLALIHDDIIDRALDRRGIDTIHTFIEKNTPIVRGDKKHFSNSQAILVGDIIFAASFQALRESQTSADVQYKIHQLLDEVIIGQMIDVNLAHGDFSTRAQIMTKSKYKTALYTFSRPFEVGALLGGISEKKQHDLYTIGEMLGVSYQLQDDYLDIFDTKNTLQKELLNDMKEGQQTLITYHILKQANEDQKKTFLKYFGKNFSIKDSKKIIKLITDLQIDTICEREILSLFEKTKRLVQNSSLSDTTQQYIINLVSLLEARM